MNWEGLSAIFKRILLKSIFKTDGGVIGAAVSNQAGYA
jgi:hypothetical protein